MGDNTSPFFAYTNKAKLHLEKAVLTSNYDEGLAPRNNTYLEKLALGVPISSLQLESLTKFSSDKIKLLTDPRSLAIATTEARVELQNNKKLQQEYFRLPDTFFNQPPKSLNAILKIVLGGKYLISANEGFLTLKAIPRVYYLSIVQNFDPIILKNYLIYKMSWRLLAKLTNQWQDSDVDIERAQGTVLGDEEGEIRAFVNLAFQCTMEVNGTLQELQQDNERLDFSKLTQCGDIMAQEIITDNSNIIAANSQKIKALLKAKRDKILEKIRNLPGVEESAKERMISHTRKKWDSYQKRDKILEKIRNLSGVEESAKERMISQTLKKWNPNQKLGKYKQLPESAQKAEQLLLGQPFYKYWYQFYTPSNPSKREEVIRKIQNLPGVSEKDKQKMFNQTVQKWASSDRSSLDQQRIAELTKHYQDVRSYYKSVASENKEIEDIYNTHFITPPGESRPPVTEMVARLKNNAKMVAPHILESELYDPTHLI